jgi:hypothetical protein
MYIGRISGHLFLHASYILPFHYSDITVNS